MRWKYLSTALFRKHSSIFLPYEIVDRMHSLESSVTVLHDPAMTTNLNRPYTKVAAINNDAKLTY